jgi:23S rRNA (uracil1939-C5)-methyltransferase
VVDLYAGAGLFSVATAIVRGAHITAVEGDRVAAADLRANVARLSGAVEAVHQSVETFAARRHVPPAVLIVDPPRTGMSKDSLLGAIRLQARTVIYVSCDVATLARDARRLMDAAYEIQRIDAFDLFPHTPHVETVVVLRKI